MEAQEAWEALSPATPGRFPFQHGYRMTESYGDPRQHGAAHEALVTLKAFSTAARLAFDRLLAARVLSEAERAIPGDDWGAWSRRLVEVGESLNLRVRSVRASSSWDRS